MNLQKRGDYMLLYYQCRRSRIKCSCSIAFLRNVEPQGSAEYNATACFVPKAISFDEPLKWRLALRGIQYRAT